MAKKFLSKSCPCCGLTMQTAAMLCVSCNVKIEGKFNETVFDRLNHEDQDFLEQYLLAGFNIKKLEQDSPLGYAAIRSRIDRLIENYKKIKKMDDQINAILKRLRNGEIDVTSAKKKIEKISGV